MGQLKWQDVKGYLQFLWRFYFPLLTRKHVREVIRWRQGRMRPGCLNRGECIICGCSIPGLEYADKQCGGSCYPPMPDKKTWETMKNSGWKETHIDLGQVKAGERYLAEFKYQGEGGPVLNGGKAATSSSCGCTQPEWDEGRNVLKVYFRPKPLPKDFLEPHKKTTKYAYILMKGEGTDNQRHTLTITALVHD